jgi:hypothetical protein
LLISGGCERDLARPRRDAANRLPMPSRLTNAREGVHNDEIEGSVDFSPIGCGIVDLQFADEVVRLTGGERESFAVGATGVLQPSAIQPNRVGEVSGITEIDHRAVLERVVGAGEGFARFDLCADVDTRKVNPQDGLARIHLIRAAHEPSVFHRALAGLECNRPARATVRKRQGRGGQPDRGHNQNIS